MFRTELPLTPHPQQLPLSARVLTIGSCFSETIGSRLTDFKVSTLVNPFGTVFNPVVACQLLRAAAGEDMDWQQHLVEARGRWQSYDLHASIGAASPVVLLQQIQDVVQRTGAFLAQADVVMLTLGTAFTYRLKETQELVNNCHKLPAEHFEKEMLTPDEIINAVAETHAYLRRKNPKLRFVLTVSPVRHLKDTLPLNSVSKSVLRVACHYLSELLPDVSYFPAYELLLDDLRDYRFYASDMLHPSAVAEDYIWEKFSRTYFDANFGRFKKEWESVRQALAHRPLYEGSPEHRHFLETTLERMQRLGSQVDLRAEIRQLHKQIVQLPPPPKIQPLPEPEVEDDEERIDVGGEAEVVSLAPVEEPRQPAEEVVSSAAAMPVATEAATPEVPFKKKRRTRGGAKRNKNKKAAQLAALAAPAEAVISETPEPVAEVPEPTAPSAPTPAPHPALPPAVAKAAAMYEASRKAAAQEAIPAVLAAPGPGEVPPVEEQLVPAEPTPATNKRPARRTASQVRASANRKPRRPAKSTTSPEQPIEAAAPATPAPPVEAAPVAPFIASPAPEPAPVQAASEVPAKPKARRPARRATPAKEKKALPPPPKPKAVAAPSPPASDSGEPAAPKKRGRPPRKKPVSPDEAPQNS